MVLQKVSCGVWSMKETLTSASKEFSLIMKFVLYLQFLPKLNTWDNVLRTFANYVNKYKTIIIPCTFTTKWVWKEKPERIPVKQISSQRSPNKITNFAPTKIHTPEQWKRTISCCSKWAWTQTEKKGGNITSLSPSLTCQKCIVLDVDDESTAFGKLIEDY